MTDRRRARALARKSLRRGGTFALVERLRREIAARRGWPAREHVVPLGASGGAGARLAVSNPPTTR